MPTKHRLDRRYAPTIGERIKQRRSLLGLSIRGAALAAGLSHTGWSRIERGERGANNCFVLAKIAGALRCPVSDLTGGMAVPDAREAASTSAAVTDVLRSIVAADPEYKSRMVDTPLLKALKERVATIRRLREACDYTNALRMLPDTVRGLHARLDGKDWREALRLLVLAEEAAASIVRYQSTAPASAMIAERMWGTARRLENPVMASLAAFQRSHASSACGAYDHARVVAGNAVDALSKEADEPGKPELLGMLMLTTAFACYGDGATSDGITYVNEAKRLAQRTGDTMTLSLYFGPTNISIWEISMEADGGDPARAIALARRTDPGQVLHVQRQVTYHLDSGRAFSHLGRDDDAFRMLIAAERLAPAHVRADPLVWETARDILERRQRRAVPPDVRAFCGRLGVAL
jgi:transcriptional regulator with XRE-family HTH domain